VAYAIDKEGITRASSRADKPIGQMVTPAHFGWFDNIPGLALRP